MTFPKGVENLPRPFGTDMANDISEFKRYLVIVEQRLSASCAARDCSTNDEPLLNGVPYTLFRKSIDISERRRDGTFFSGPNISVRIAKMLKQILTPQALVCDPTCGIGDLLLAYAALLPIDKTLFATLTSWGHRLGGLELRPDLVRMTKVRLATLARVRGRFQDPIDDVDQLFPLIRVGDMLQAPELLSRADGFLFNPPFCQTLEYKIASWSSGRVNAAALLLAALVESKRKDAPIAAILPEVLRCGSRYERFRQHLAGQLSGSYTSIGRFDPWTDVDVFITLLTNVREAPLWRSDRVAASELSVGDRFDVRVGPLVPHRHDNRGPWRRFVCAKSVPPWADAFAPSASRRFRGAVFKPPFVVIRRTSSPSDKRRAVGAIIVGERHVAVENHLIVAMPKDGTLNSCSQLLKVLRHDAASNYLNRIIRCRHLTTRSVMSIPWIESDD
jgi:hypothetical protein